MIMMFSRDKNYTIHFHKAILADHQKAQLAYMHVHNNGYDMVGIEILFVKDTCAICCYNGYGYAVVDVRFFTQVILRLVVFPPFQET